jgi:uroporphyrinogen decarboxylase
LSSYIVSPVNYLTVKFKKMNSRERILATLNHQEPDKVPFDLAGTTWTGIANGAYKNLLAFNGMESQEPQWSDVIQQIVVPSDDILNDLEVDTRGLFPLTSSNWDVYKKLTDKGDSWEYLDEWGFTLKMPKNGHWFSFVKHPMQHILPEAQEILNYNWPLADDKRRIADLREQAIRFKEQGKIVMIKGLCAGIFEMHQRCRGMENALLDSFLYPEFSDLLIGKIADLKIEFWEMALSELGDVVDIVAEGDDYGTQESQLIDPDHFRQYYKPHIARIVKSIKQNAPNSKVMFHSCGNVRPEIPDFIEMGIDILNPVHVNATGMEPSQLKRDFGKDIVFWGGGVDTQRILPSGTVNEVIDDVKKNIDALASGGGFVFATVHNIQSEVPPQNIIAMWETLNKYGKY